MAKKPGKLPALTEEVEDADDADGHADEHPEGHAAAAVLVATTQPVSERDSAPTSGPRKA